MKGLSWRSSVYLLTRFYHELSGLHVKHGYNTRKPLVCGLYTILQIVHQVQNLLLKIIHLTRSKL